jgi:hypothetical protein
MMFKEFAPRPVGEGGRTMRGDVISASIKARLLGQPSHGAPLHVIMILASGFVAECGKPLAPGSQVAVNLTGMGLVPAEVRWTLGERTGFKFANPLTLDQLRRLA